MGLRDLVVLLDGSARDRAKMAIAVELARRNDAHLTGLCPLEVLLPADLSFALGGYPDLWALPEFAKQIEGQARTRAAVIEADFREAAAPRRHQRRLDAGDRFVDVRHYSSCPCRRPDHRRSD